MQTKTWKSAERKIASLLGGERVPITGRTRGSAPDIQHDTLSLEVKHWQKFPEWLKDAMNQAEMSATNDQIPTVVLHEKGSAYDRCLTIMPLFGTIELLNRIEKLEAENEMLRDELQSWADARSIGGL